MHKLIITLLFQIILFLFLNPFVFAAALTCSVQEGGGGDETSLESCLANNEQDLTDGGGDTFTINIEGTWTADDTTAASVDSWTTDATNFITIITDSSSKHDGKRYGSKTTAYRLRPATGKALVSTVDFTVFEGIQMQSTDNHAIEFTAENNKIESCILHGNFRAWNTADGPSIARNSLFISDQDSGFNVANTFNPFVTSIVDNNTFIGQGGSGNGYNTGGGTTTFTNNLIFAPGTCINSAPGTTNTFTSGTQDTTGSSGLINLTDSNEFVSVTGGSEDFHLKAGSTLLDVGTDLSGTFTNDIDGDTRPQGDDFDVGSDELVTAAVTRRVIMVTKNFKDER